MAVLFFAAFPPGSKHADTVKKKNVQEKQQMNKARAKLDSRGSRLGFFSLSPSLIALKLEAICGISAHKAK